MFDKLLIANRGEIACRIIRTARKMNIRTVAVYSEMDANALHVQLADESVCIGPALSSASYLDSGKIIQATVDTHAQAVHPGYGFLSEDAEFAEQLQQAGLIFVGPSAHAIRTMGDKNLAKTTMVKAGVPVVPGYHGDVVDIKAFQKAAQKIGFPVLIKASAGGGGKGMRLVESADKLADAVQSAMREAQASFGDSRVFLEKYLTHSRHIEVQILFDQHGKGIYLFDRDCSIQRRHQKIVEEAPACHLTAATKQQMAETALRAGEAIHYSSTGTIEFLVDENENFYFMEMNTRLQVEHPVTEMITGLDLVEWQLRIAAGEKLSLKQSAIACQGHAIEARLYAENPENNFMPSAGVLKYFQLPAESTLPEQAVRIDSGFQAHDVVSIYYDPLLAKLIAWGKNRMQAIETLQQLLQETAVAGIHTNWTLLNRIAHNPQFIQGKITTHFIAEQHAQLLSKSEQTPDAVIIIACLTLIKSQQVELQQRQHQSADTFSPWFAQDNWRLHQPAQSIISFWQQDKNWRINHEVTSAGNVKFSWENHGIEARADWQSHNCLTLHCNHRDISALIFMDDGQIIIYCEGEQWSFSFNNPAASGVAVVESGLKAPMPGTVVEIYVQPGQTVAAGERLLVMEAMKMEHAVFAPRAGKIQTVFYQAGDRVNEGAQLIAFFEEAIGQRK